MTIIFIIHVKDEPDRIVASGAVQGNTAEAVASVMAKIIPLPVTAALASGALELELQAQPEQPTPQDN